MAKRTRPVVGVQRRYEWRLYPTPEQAFVLHEQAVMCADLWNALLSMCEERYRRARCGRTWHCAECATRDKLCDQHKLPSEFTMGYWVSEMLAECPEWRVLSTWTPRRVATSLCAAYAAFFRRAKAGAGAQSGYPRYKATRRAMSIPHRCVSGCRIVKSDRHETSWTVRLKGVPGEIWARGRVPASVNEWMDADIRLDDRGGEISIAVAIEERRESRGHLRPATVRFDLLDSFAVVNNESETSEELLRAQILDDQRAVMQSDFDLRWPRGKRWTDDEWQERCEQKAAIGHFASRVARIRRNALHVWSKQIVERASVLTIHRPSVKEHTQSPRGDEREWGANVGIVSTLNRNTLSYAPAMAAQMLEYKAREIGIPCEVIEDQKPEIAVGEKLVAAGKAVRKSKRAIKEKDNGRNQQGTRRTGRSDRRSDGAGDGSHEPQGRS